MQELKVVLRRRVRRSSLAGLLAALIAAGAAGAVASQNSIAGDSAQAGVFVDPLDAPAIMYRSVAGRPLMAVAHAGARLVAAGMRGLVAISDDGGKSWTQVSAPVRSDLLAVNFPTASQGWIVGHDGVVIHTSDGGRTWTKQLDGRMAADVLRGYYEKRIAAGEAALQPYLDQLKLNYRSGPSLPFLSVWFRDAQHGMAVGPFGMAIATDDGGVNWYPLLDQIDNPQFLHMQAVREVAGHLYIAAEKGTVFRLDALVHRFVPVATGYEGSLFGVVGNDDVLFAYGLKGAVYRSTDHGLNWIAVRTPLRGTVTGATYVEKARRFVFVSAAGEVAVCDASAQEMRLLKPAHPMATTGVDSGADDALVLSGLEGTSLAALQ
jgi:photosystem II stability/assembly factor-like uncharacterized protein